MAIITTVISNNLFLCTPQCRDGDAGLPGLPAAHGALGRLAADDLPAHWALLWVLGFRVLGYGLGV